MNKKSAGILAWKIESKLLKVLLVHPGGPYFTNKNAGSWSIPKGEYGDDEEPLTAAKREFAEETGIEINGEFAALTPVKQKSGKIVAAWAVEADVDITDFRPGTFAMEWPPKSGSVNQYPEVDKAEWFTLDVAKELLNPAQVAFIDELERHVKFINHIN